ncbi:endonuclease/exonuclease/phosphatase family protein [Trifolium medium]|uniref:Endonuclease/exonuclease/phosphatase family protein n=1 Tax=Trifolium medium TaxID=97028 RepID=A0A392MSJ1_9FABA|nr:endonuclease/exonuclease/phosphatase family protein [Trifolium medium]
MYYHTMYNNKPEVIVIMETSKLLGFDMCYSDCRGFTGGILIAWKELWQKLLNISRNIHGSWPVAGDFNDTVFPDEKKGGAVVSIRKCNIFLNNINACKLMDVGSVGARFTWMGPLYQGQSRIFERLDRALCNDEWRLQA